jgi:hypothetical protein
MIYKKERHSPAPVGVVLYVPTTDFDQAVTTSQC